MSHPQFRIVTSHTAQKVQTISKLEGFVLIMPHLTARKLQWTQR